MDLTSVIINKGILKSLPKPPKIGTLVHFSSSTALSLSPNRKMLTGTVKEAVALGAMEFHFTSILEVKKNQKC